MSSVGEKSLVKLIIQRNLISPGLSESGGKSQELSLQNGNLTLAQANCQAFGSTQLQNVTEMLNMKG